MSERSGALVRQKFREYLLPVLLASFAFSVGSLAESMMIGHFLDPDALSAVGLASPFLLCIDVIFLLFSVGGITSAMIALGKLETRKANLIFTLTLAGVAIAMLLLSLGVGSRLYPLVLSLADGNETITHLAVIYLQPVLIAAPFDAFARSAAGFISVDGKPRYSCLMIVVSALLRISLGYVLIFHLHAGIRGAGIAFLAGSVGCFLMAVPCLLRKQRCFHVVLPRARDIRLLLPVLKSGFNSSWTSICEMISSFWLIALIAAAVGSDGLSILVVCTNIALVLEIVMGGVTDTLLPLTSSLYGERDYFGIRQIVRFALVILMAASAVLTLLFWFLPEYAAILFGVDSPEIVAKLKPAMRMYILHLPLYALSSFLQHYYNIIGYEKLSSLLIFLKTWLFAVLFALLLTRLSGEMIWLCYFCAEVCALLVIFLLSLRLKRRAKLQDLLLLPAGSANVSSFDFTIVAGVQAAGELSQRITAFGRTISADQKLLNHVAVAMEEMTLATAHYAHKDRGNGLIDVAIRVKGDGVYVRFRDNGAPFNPLEYIPPEGSRHAGDGILLLRKMASHLHYSRQLGFNTTNLTFARTCPQDASQPNRE